MFKENATKNNNITLTNFKHFKLQVTKTVKIKQKIKNKTKNQKQNKKNSDRV